MRNAFYDNMRSKQGIPDQVPLENFSDADDPNIVKIKLHLKNKVQWQINLHRKTHM